MIDPESAELTRRDFLQLVAWAAVLSSTGCSRPLNRRKRDWQVHEITDDLLVVRAAANGGLLSGDSGVLAIPGDPRAANEAIAVSMFLDARRDAQWPGLEEETVRNRSSPGREPASESGHDFRVLVPEAAERFFRSPDEIWSWIHEERFHDYVQPSPRVITEPVSITETISGGRTLEWGDHRIEILETPGYSRHAVSCLVEDGGRRVAFTGDLVYGEGQILELFSLQAGMPDARILGYHGYLSRASKLIESLEAVLAWEPDLLVPARGPIVRDPEASARLLIRRLRRIYESYLSTTALRWDATENLQIAAGRILGSEKGTEAPDAPEILPESVAVAETRDPPSWIDSIRNSRLLLSDSGAALLVDCGPDILEEVARRRREGEFQRVEGIYITHYHDDHTDQAQKAAERFDCPIYCCPQMEDILRHPSRYWLPAQTRNPISSLQVMEVGARMTWHELDLTFSSFPGQTRYDGGLLLERSRGHRELDAPVFLAGDSLTPTGLNDHCMQNRNLLHEETGYLYCLDRLLEMDPLPWIVNQHVEPIFRFTRDQLRDLADEFRARRELIATTVPWDDPNFGVDAGWARCYPYEVHGEPGSPTTLEVRLFNHSSRPGKFSIRPNPPPRWEVTTFEEAKIIDARAEDALRIELRPLVPEPTELTVLTVDVQTPQRTLRRWVEALLVPR